MDALADRTLGAGGRTRRLIRIGGLVQGVGFRPFVYRAAVARGLTGWVANEPAGVVIDVEGDAAAVEAFLTDLPREAPALSRIERMENVSLPPVGYESFTIRTSVAEGERTALVSPDLATCPDCLRELFDPRDRRYRYPFINCTNCGPRYTIIDGLPYDRPLTAMRSFAMCSECAREYHDPADRRFHAQPDACPECGPRVWYSAAPDADPVRDWAAIEAAAAALLRGEIVAVKGLGGFHLACDAGNEDAVRRLRAAKYRSRKPLALMVPDREAARRLCRIDAAEEALLTSPRAPIVLLDKKTAHEVGSGVAASVAPDQLTLGVMLPYTPLQHLLLRLVGRPLVMTSGNVSDQPLAADNDEAERDLRPLATGGLLLHNRDIPHRCDDSVARIVSGRQIVVRRARGYAPAPLPFSDGGEGGGDIIAVGGQEKAAFCITKGNRAFLSHHIGDLDSARANDFFRESLAHYRSLFAPATAVVACDLHPDYASTRLAAALAAEPVRLVKVQHHHAHIAAVMGEHGLEGPVIGVAYDGTGLGEDGTLWGGEILIADRRAFRRYAHLSPFPLPGGELAVRRPYRTAYGILFGAVARAGGQTGLRVAAEDAVRRLGAAISATERAALDFQLARGLNAPLSTSMGRLFDAAAALSGFAGACSYDAEAAIWLETLAGPYSPGDAEPYPGEFIDAAQQIDGAAILCALAADLAAGAAPAVAARRFHATVAAVTRALCRRARAETGIRQVCLGGGVFMNRRLLAELIELLEADGHSVYVPSEAPINDGGLAYGQAVVARARQLTCEENKER